MRAIVYKGQSQYDALRYFADNFAEGLRQHGVDVYIVDLLSVDAQKQINNAVSSGKIDVVFSFNGVGVEFNVNGKSFYEIIKAKFFAIYVDHPIVHYQRLLQSPESSISTFIDNDHLECSRMLMGGGSFSAQAFLPHGGIKSIKSPVTNKRRFVFAGSLKNTTELKWRNSGLNKVVVALIDNVYDLIKSENNLPIHSALDNVLTKKGLSFSQDIWLKLLSQCFFYINPVRTSENRLRLLEYFNEIGAEVDIYGPDTWLSYCNDMKNLNYIGQLDMITMVEEMSKYKFVLNDNNDFTFGSHERVFNALLNFSIPISPENEFYRNEANLKKFGVYYKRNDFTGMPTSIKQFDDIYEFLIEKLPSQQNDLVEDFSWTTRARSALEIYQMCSV